MQEVYTDPGVHHWHCTGAVLCPRRFLHPRQPDTSFTNGHRPDLNCQPHPSTVFPPDPEKKLDTLTPRLIYCLVNGLGLAYACYRIYGMGLFPTHLTDWASTIPAPIVTEVAVSSLW